MFAGEVRPHNIKHKIFNALNTSIHIVTSVYKKTEQNGEPHSNLSLFTASYSPHTAGS